MNEDIAELFGALLGDGCLSKYWSKSDKRYRHVVAFTGHWKKDSQYYKNVIQPIVKQNFGVNGYLYHRKDDDTIRYFITSKKVSFFLNHLGMPFGRKYDKITIPECIRIDLTLSKACMSGIFNTDGSVYRRYGKKYSNHPKHYKKYAVVQFKMKNKDIISFIKSSLETMGLKVTKICREGEDYWVLRITSQNHIDKFFDELNIRHDHHKRRFEEIRNG